jgi:hypothetical protein
MWPVALVDAWQREVLLSKERQLLLNCCRQEHGVAALALHQALFCPGSLVLILSAVQRLSSETFRKVQDFYGAVGRQLQADGETQLCIEPADGWRILCLPNVEGIRGPCGTGLGWRSSTGAQE